MAYWLQFRFNRKSRKIHWISENRIQNLIETAELFQNVFKNKSFEKEDIHSIFREKDKFIIILKNKKVLKIKVSHSLMESIY